MSPSARVKLENIYNVGHLISGFSIQIVHVLTIVFFVSAF